MAEAHYLRNIRRVAIIGAGPVGLAAAKYLLAENHFSTIDIYEQQPGVGGAWLRIDPFTKEFFSVPQTNPFQPLQEPKRINSSDEGSPMFMTPMYDSLETNIPKKLMQFSDLPFPEEWQLFPTRQEVVKYIETYAEDVRHLIKFHTQVVKIEHIEDLNRSWEVKSKNLKTHQVQTKSYDAIAVCSGHFTVPNIPSFTGIEKFNSSYPGVISHAKWYRNPTPFIDKKVLVIGNAASGLDISAQISRVSQLPLLLSQRGPSLFGEPESKNEECQIKVLPAIEEFIDPSVEDRAVRFTNGHTEANIDFVLFATGYIFSFPFLPLSKLDILDDGTWVRHVYQHFLHNSYPSIAFLGLPIKILPFPLGEVQAAVLARVWSGRLQVPSADKMKRWEEDTAKANGSGKGFHTLYFPKDFEYQRVMYDWAVQASGSVGKLPVRFDEKSAWTRERFPAIRGAFTAMGQERASIRTLEQLGFNYEEWIQKSQNTDQGTWTSQTPDHPT